MTFKRRNFFLVGTISFLMIPFAAQFQAKTKEKSTSMNDHSLIINAVNGIGIFADLRDWKQCRQCFTQEVEFDYTSLLAGKPEIVSAEKQIQQWAEFFKNTFKSTQHLIASHAVFISGNNATCTSNFQAFHTYLDSAKGNWTLRGVYNHNLTRSDSLWKVNKMKMTWTSEEGMRPF